MIDENSGSFNIMDMVKFRVEDRDSLLKRTLIKDLTKEYCNYKVSNLVDENLDFLVSIEDRFTDSEDLAYVYDDKLRVRKDYIHTRDSYKLAEWTLELRGSQRHLVLVISPNLFARLFISGFFIDYLIQLTATWKGISIVHSSGSCKDNSAFLFSGRGGAGKTTVSTSLLARGHSLLGDDFNFVRNGEVVPYFTPLNVFSYNVHSLPSLALKPKQRLSLFMKESLFHLTRGYAKIFEKVNPSDAFPEHLGTISRLRAVFLLFPTTDSRGSIERTAREKAMKQMTLNMRMDSKYFPKYMIGYACMGESDRFTNYWEQYERSLSCNIPQGVPFYEALLPIGLEGRSSVVNQIDELCRE